MKYNDIKIPTRKAKKTFWSVTGYFPSKKNNRNMFFESMLEKKLFLTLEFDNNVLKYLEQPVKIDYKNGSRNTYYHPDCLVTYINKLPELIEVKYSSDLETKKDELAPKFDIVRKYAKENGYIFKTFTEEDINELKIQNMEFLYSFAFLTANDHLEQEILKKLANKEVSASILLDKLTPNKFEQAKYLPYIWSLSFRKILYIDFYNSKINMDTIIRLNNE